MGYTVHNFQPNEVLHASELNEMDAQILNNLVNTATIQTTNVAVKNYVVGEYLTYNGILYEVTAAIASGGTITPETNCTQTNVGAELTAANAEIASVRESLSTSMVGTAYNGIGIHVVKYGKLLLISFVSGTTTNAVAAVGTLFDFSSYGTSCEQIEMSYNTSSYGSSTGANIRFLVQNGQSLVQTRDAIGSGQMIRGTVVVLLA